jgi:hypothetical protein
MKPQTSQGASNPVFQTDSLPQLSQQILENAYQSFTVLIDSRLRAYASFLARHAMAVADEKTNEMGMFSVEQKLETLLDVGGKITVSRVSTRFDVAEVEGVQEGDHYSFPLSFYVEMSLMIPRPLATDEMVSVAFSAPGTIAGKSLLPFALETLRWLPQHAAYVLTNRFVPRLCQQQWLAKSRFFLKSRSR